MSTFERIYQIDPARETDDERENLSIALSDQEYLQKIRRERHAIDISPTLQEPHAKSESKTAKRKPKKDHPKRNAPAVESIQEKL